jgi:ketosteroid isomerase-like protein
MKLCSVAALLICALVVGGVLVGSAGAKDNADAQIRALEDQFTRSINAKDVNAIMALYVPSNELFVFDVIPPRQYVGWDAYKKDWQDFLGSVQGPIKTELSALQITSDGGDLAYSHSIQHVTGTSNNKPFDLVLRFTHVYRKINGKWLIVHEHASVPVDLDTNKPDLLSKP